MALKSKIVLSLNLEDATANFNVDQSKTVEDVTEDLVMVDDTYVLPLTQPAFLEITKGDIVTIKSATIIVTAKGVDFLGVSVGFADTIPSEGSFTVKDVFTFSGEFEDSIWVKNLDVAECVIRVIMTGLNA